MTSVKEFAEFSDKVYSLEVPDEWELKDWEDSIVSLGFKAAAYQRGNEIVIAFAGTNDKFDCIDDTSFLFKILPGQSWLATRFFEKNFHYYKDFDVSITGHSLGGALASVVGNKYALHTVTFNSPGVLGLTTLDINLSNFKMTAELKRNEEASGKIHHQLIFEDLVSHVKTHIGKEHWAGAKNLTGNEDYSGFIKKVHSINQWLEEERYDSDGNFKEVEINDYGYPVDQA